MLVDPAHSIKKNLSSDNHDDNNNNNGEPILSSTPQTKSQNANLKKDNDDNDKDDDEEDNDDDAIVGDPLWASIFPKSNSLSASSPSSSSSSSSSSCISSSTPSSNMSSSCAEMYDDLGFPFDPRVVTPRKEKIDSEYDVKEEIGKGKFGRVHKAVHKTTGKSNCLQATQFPSLPPSLKIAFY